MAIEQCENRIEERSTVATKQLELEETVVGEISFGSLGNNLFFISSHHRLS